MAEETNNNQEQQQAESPAQDEGKKPEQKPTDWKAEARKWEQRAKENSAAADELAKLKESQMSELEKAQAKAQQFEAENKMLKAQKELSDYIEGAAEKNSVPIQFLKLLSDESAVDAFVEAWEAWQKEQESASTQNLQPIHSAPKAQQQRLINQQGKQISKRDMFAQFFGE